MSDQLFDALRAQFEADAARRANGSSPTSGPEPLQEAAFHGLPGRVVATIYPHSEADAAALLLQFLVAFGNCVGRGPHVRVEGDEHHPCLYAAMVGESAKARKGTSWGRIRQVVAHVDPAWAQDQIAGGLSSGEGLIHAVRDPIVKRVAVKDEKTKQPTGEWRDEIEDPGVEDKRLLVLESELSRHFDVMGRQGNTLSETLRRFWDDGSARAMTRNSPLRATSAHVSIIGHIPVDELRMKLTKTEAANGFANRFLWAYVRRSKSLPFGGDIPLDEIEAIRADAADRVRRAREVGRVTFTPAARRLWESVYDELSEGRPGLLGAITARSDPQALRLALVYALTDASSVVEPDHLHAALAVWRYCEQSAHYIFGDAIGDPLADDIVRELAARPSGMTRTEIRDIAGTGPSQERIQVALNLLRRHGLAYMTREDTGGRSAERWRAGAGAGR